MVSTLVATWLLRLSEQPYQRTAPDHALVAWEAAVLVLAPFVVCLSMRHQKAYSGALPAKGRALIAASFWSWTYAAGLFGLFVAATVSPLQILLHEWPDGPLQPDDWFLVFFSVGLAGTILNRIFLVGTASLTQATPAKQAEGWAVIGDAVSAAMVVSWLEQTHRAATGAIAIIPFSPYDHESAVEYVRSRGIRRVFVALSGQRPRAAIPLLRSLSALAIVVRFVPDFSSVAELGYGLRPEGGIPVLRVSDPPLSRPAMIAKRVEDIIMSAILLVLAAPAMLCAAVAIKLDTPGPVLFRQPRHGFNGETIQVLKFRTMRMETEDRFANQQTQVRDPRLTRVGAFLRRHSLDELPQLLNVLRGDMSLVGPRPHAPGTTAGGSALHEVVENYAARHRVKPGITGWAQVRGWRGNLDCAEKAVRRVECDLYYVENWSILLDFKIILGTIALMIRDTNAY